jgi:hypothetical protein
MSAINTISRRSFVSAGASLVATGASFMMLPNLYATIRGETNDPSQQPCSEAHALRVQEGHHTDEEMQKCIQLCRDCYAMCIQTISHCLKLGGHHATLDHIRLFEDCAQMCLTAADYMLRESPFHDRICRLCSDLCKQCGKDCERLAGDDRMIKECMEMCRKCAGSCERMASKVAA